MGAQQAANFSSSSDEECEANLKPKLPAKRLLVCNKPSTSSADSKLDSLKMDEIYMEDVDNVFEEECLNKPGVNTRENGDEDENNKMIVELDNGIVNNQEAEQNCTKVIEDDSAKRTQKKKRRKQNKKNVNLPSEFGNDKTLTKYWYNRYRLFSRFDEGIKLDRGEF